MAVVNAFSAQQTVLGMYVVTRVQDPANNVNKYRRFIVLWNADDARQKALITQTGRWTLQCDQGSWVGIGSTKFQRLASVAWERNDTPVDFLEKHIARKLGEYTRTSTSPMNGRISMSTAEVQHVITASGLNNPLAPGPAQSPAQPQGAAVSTMSALEQAVAGAAPTIPTRPGRDAPIWEHSSWLLRVASAGDEFELLTAYGEIKKTITVSQAKLGDAMLELDAALNIIVSGKGA